MKVGQTGKFLWIHNPYELGDFLSCRILEIRGETVLVELLDGSQGEIPANEFTPAYMIWPEEVLK